MSETYRWEKVLWLTVHNGWESIFISDSKSDFLLHLYSTLWFDFIFNDLGRMFKSIDWNMNWSALWDFFDHLHWKFIRRSIQDWSERVLSWKLLDSNRELTNSFNKKILNLRDFFKSEDNRNKKFAWVEVWEKISSISEK